MTCPKCHGEKTIEKLGNHFNVCGYMSKTVRVPCNYCRGTGEVHEDEALLKSEPVEIFPRGQSGTIRDQRS